MRKLNRRLAESFSIALLSTSAIVISVPASAQTYLGEACWLINTEGSESEGDDFLQLAVFDIGDNHFTMNGFSFSTDDESVDERMLLTGNAEIFAESVITINLSGTTSNDEETVSAGVNAKLSLSTLSGSFEILGTILDKVSEEIVQGTEAGTMTITECPVL